MNTSAKPRPLHAIVADLVPAQSTVLDLGCGDGSLLAHLIQHKNCTGYGVELNIDNVESCLEKNVSVLQINIDNGLRLFEADQFDCVLQINSLQNLRNVEGTLKEAARVARHVIVTFPNFAHWRNRLSIARGTMPVNKVLPYEWYNTPNIRVGTFRDFQRLARRLGLEVLDSYGVHIVGDRTDGDARPVRFAANLFANTAVFILCRQRVNAT